MRQRIRAMYDSICDRFFADRYDLAGARAARLAVCWATIIWALIVLYEPNAFLYSNYGMSAIWGWWAEDYWALAYIAIAGTQLVRMWRHSPPRQGELLMSALLCFLWSYQAFGRFLYGPLPAGETAWIAIGAWFSWWNLLGIGKASSA